MTRLFITLAALLPVAFRATLVERLGCSLPDVPCHVHAASYPLWLALAKCLWYVNKVLLQLARWLEGMVSYLVSGDESLLGSGFAILGERLTVWLYIAGIGALILFIVGYMLSPLVDANWVRPKKALLHGFLALALFAAGSSALSAAESFRLGLSGVMSGVAQDVFGPSAPAKFYAASETTLMKVAPVYAPGSPDCPGMTVQRATSEMHLNDVATRFLLADAVDTHCGSAALGVPTDWQQAFLPDSTAFSSDNENDRTEAIGLAIDGLWRMVLGIVISIAAVVEAAMNLLFGLALVLTFFSLAIGLVFGLFAPMQEMVQRPTKAMASIIKTSMMTSFGFGLLIALCQQAMATQSSTAVLAASSVSLVAGLVATKTAFGTLSMAAGTASVVAGGLPTAVMSAGAGLVRGGVSLGAAVATGGASLLAGGALAGAGAAAAGGAAGARSTSSRRARTSQSGTVGQLVRRQRQAYQRSGATAAATIALPDAQPPAQTDAWWEKVEQQPLAPIAPAAPYQTQVLNQPPATRTTQAIANPAARRLDQVPAPNMQRLDVPPTVRVEVLPSAPPIEPMPAPTPAQPGGVAGTAAPPTSSRLGVSEADTAGELAHRQALPFDSAPATERRVSVVPVATATEPVPGQQPADQRQPAPAAQPQPATQGKASAHVPRGADEPSAAHSGIPSGVKERFERQQRGSSLIERRRANRAAEMPGTPMPVVVSAEARAAAPGSVPTVAPAAPAVAPAAAPGESSPTKNAALPQQHAVAAHTAAETSTRPSAPAVQPARVLPPQQDSQPVPAAPAIGQQHAQPMPVAPAHQPAAPAMAPALPTPAHQPAAPTVAAGPVIVQQSAPPPAPPQLAEPHHTPRSTTPASTNGQTSVALTPLPVPIIEPPATVAPTPMVQPAAPAPQPAPQPAPVVQPAAPAPLAQPASQPTPAVQPVIEQPAPVTQPASAVQQPALARPIIVQQPAARPVAPAARPAAQQQTGPQRRVAKPPTLARRQQK